jgi:hypothetical protein
MFVVEVVILAVVATNGNPSTPVLPGGGIIAWIICNGRKRNPIGGWLLFYYWQLWSGLFVSAVFFAINIQSYVPENFDSGRLFGIFLASTVPVLLLLLVQLVVATVILSFRTPDMLRLLRWTLVAQVVAVAVGAAIDAKYYPDNIAFSVLALIQETLWMFYFFKSTRVRHVFESQDWEIAVHSIYPLNPKLST